MFSRRMSICQARCRLFSIFIAVILSCIFVFLFPSCDKGSAEFPLKAGQAIRLTKGTFEDGMPSFSADGKKMLITRNIPKNGSGAKEHKGIWNRHVIEIDISNPARPKESEIEEFYEGSDPSYKGETVVAKDRSSSLVALVDGKLEPVRIENLNSMPAKPSVSPNGKWIVFMGINAPKFEPGQNPPDLNNFRYQPHIVSSAGGVAEKIEIDIGPNTFLEDLRWTSKNTLHLYYRLENRDVPIFRVQEYDVENKTSKLALISDYFGRFDVSDDSRYLVANSETPNSISFVSRDLKTRIDTDLRDEVMAVSLVPNSNWAVVSRYCEDTRGINLFLLPVPEQFKN